MPTPNVSKKPEVREYRCVGIHKHGRRVCAKLLYKMWSDSEAIIIEIKCPDCNEFLIKKFRSRRNEKCISLSLT